MTKTRVDNRLQLGYGSAWHLLRYLRWQRDAMNKSIAAELRVSNVRWLDFPPDASGQVYPTDVPIRDGEWTRLAFVHRESDPELDTPAGNQHAVDRLRLTVGETAIRVTRHDAAFCERRW